jgi:hypothetical protein
LQIEKGFTDNWLQSTGAQENLMRQYAGCKWFVWNLIHRASPRKTTLRERKHYEEENWETETDELRREDDCRS